MRSKQYGVVTAKKIAEEIQRTDLTLDIEKEKPLAVTAACGVSSKEGFWHKVTGEVHLPPDLLVELAKHQYRDIARMVGERCALDVYELLVLGDTQSDDKYLNILDGSLRLGKSKVHVDFTDDEALLEIVGDRKGGALIAITLYLRVTFSD